MEGLVDSADAFDDEVEGQYGTEEELDDVTKGFCWLRDMELWARFE
jgi:hypothetical protein